MGGPGTSGSQRLGKARCLLSGRGPGSQSSPVSVQSLERSQKYPGYQSKSHGAASPESPVPGLPWTARVPPLPLLPLAPIAQPPEPKGTASRGVVPAEGAEASVGSARGDTQGRCRGTSRGRGAGEHDGAQSQNWRCSRCRSSRSSLGRSLKSRGQKSAPSPVLLRVFAVSSLTLLSVSTPPLPS